MRIESVRDLKQSLPTLLARTFAAAEVRSRSASVATARAASPASAVASYALGITARKRNDYRLAVRVQHRDLLGSDLIAAIKARAKGEVEVRYIGRVTAGAATTGLWYRKRQRPLLIGVSCGYVRSNLSMAGTLGCFVMRRSGGGAMILSNNHVLADEGRYPRKGEIVQPGALDNGTPGKYRVASLTSFVRFRKIPGANYVDAAVAALETDVAFNPSKLQGLGKLQGLAPNALDVGDAVHKIGRTTGLRSGRVTAIELDGVQVEYDTGIFSFDNQVEIEGEGTRAFSDAGDSGSLIVTDGLRGAALLFAGSDEGGTRGKSLTYANPLKAVLSRMRLKLLTA